MTFEAPFYFNRSYIFRLVSSCPISFQPISFHLVLSQLISSRLFHPNFCKNPHHISIKPIFLSRSHCHQTKPSTRTYIDRCTPSITQNAQNPRPRFQNTRTNRLRPRLPLDKTRPPVLSSRRALDGRPTDPAQPRPKVRSSLGRLHPQPLPLQRQSPTVLRTPSRRSSRTSLPSDQRETRHTTYLAARIILALGLWSEWSAIASEKFLGPCIFRNQKCTRAG